MTGNAAAVDHNAQTRMAIAAIDRILDAAAAEPDLLTRDVPGCPGWTTYDLVAHLGEVHRWVVTAIDERHGRGTSPAPPREPEALRAWFAEGAAVLRDRLAGPPERPVWSFSAVPGHDTLAFWRRRQAHENLVHRYDAQSATGVPDPLDPMLAADGIAEVIEVFIPRMRAREILGELPGTVRVRATDVGAEWLVGDHPGRVVAEVAGGAQDLLLHLWKRADESRLTWSGDADAGRATLARPLVP